MIPWVRDDGGDDAIPREEFTAAPADDPEPRNFSIFKTDVNAHGPTEGCRGCRGLLRGYRDKHSSECRDRFGQIFQNDPEKKNRLDEANERKARAVVREAEEQWTQQGLGAGRMRSGDAAGASSRTGGGGGHAVATAGETRCTPN